MKITQAFAEADAAGYPILRLTIDGHAAYVLEPKQSLLDAGIVVLLDHEGHWEKAVSTVYQPDGEVQPTRLAGAVGESALTDLVRRFVAGETGNLLTA
jgi:hypothetical protein